MAMSAAQRAAVSRRMTKYWAQRRAAGRATRPRRRVRRKPVDSFVMSEHGGEILPSPIGNGVPRVQGRVVVQFGGQEMQMSIDEAKQLQSGLRELLNAVIAVTQP